jgi:DNA-3-methyladenine glycosylase
MTKPLPRAFYARDAKEVAKDLLGKIVVRKLTDGTIKAKIVETEAYYGEQDPASHAFRGRTKRAKIMWEKPGVAYVYLIYGMYYLFNIVTEEKGKAGAVLIRALDPLEGIGLMKKIRKIDEIKDLTNGPGKLTQALSITNKEHKQDLISGPLIIEEGIREEFEIISSIRIGVSAGGQAELRFYIKGNESVSKR